jgi:hypothetical protein
MRPPIFPVGRPGAISAILLQGAPGQAEEACGFGRSQHGEPSPNNPSRLLPGVRCREAAEDKRSADLDLDGGQAGIERSRHRAERFLAQGTPERASVSVVTPVMEAADNQAVIVSLSAAIRLFVNARTFS